MPDVKILNTGIYFSSQNEIQQKSMCLLLTKP